MIDFVDLGIQELKMVLNWRNSSFVRKCMYSQGKISLEDHMEFIHGLQFSKEKQHMVVKKEGKYIGVVNFTNINRENKSSYLGLYANPFKRTAGVGKTLQETCLKYIFELLNLKKIKLEVFSDNIRAITLYERFDFKKTEVKSIDKKSVICMELVR